jgi:hypothetical protein
VLARSLRIRGRCNNAAVRASSDSVQLRSFFQMKELFMHELYAWLSGQHPGLKTFKTLQLKLSQLAVDHPEQRAMCRLLHGVVGNYIEEFDEAPLPSAVAERAYQRLLGSLAELDSSADPARQLGNLNRLAALDLTQ